MPFDVLATLLSTRVSSINVIDGFHLQAILFNTVPHADVRTRNTVTGANYCTLVVLRCVQSRPVTPLAFTASSRVPWYVINVFTMKLSSVYLGEVLESIISYGLFIARGGCDLTRTPPSLYAHLLPQVLDYLNRRWG